MSERCTNPSVCSDCGEVIFHEPQRGIFLLDIEHDPAALQALETYAYAVNVQGDRPLCDELIQKINEVRKAQR